jgi:hypothetical protein
MRTVPGALAVALALAGSAPTVVAQEGPEVAVLAGAYDVAKSDGAEAGLEARFPIARPARWKLVAVAGAAGTNDGAAWIYGGVQRPFELAPAWRLVPGFAISLYQEGSEGKDLGGPVEFRSSLELARAIGRGMHLGLAVYHLSNARLYDDNPGSNSVVLVLSFPLRR